MQRIEYRALTAMLLISHKHPLPAKSTVMQQRKKQLRNHWIETLLKHKISH